MGTYLKLKETLMAQLEKLSHIQGDGVGNMPALTEKLRRGTFNLVLLGQFKRGKSTFINALLGEPVLPTAIVPLTSVVTILGYGDQKQAEIIYQDGHRDQITFDQLSEYITEKGNPGNHKKVRQAEISYPSDYLRDGVQIIDTPGVGSIYDYNTEVAYNFLPSVDAAIFVVAVDPPLSAAEKEFLQDIREYAPKLFFILNKIDYVEEAERQEALEFTSRALQVYLARDRVKIYPISAKLALEGKQQGRPDLVELSQLPRFENYLQNFLYQEKGRVLLISCLNGALKAITDSTLSLKVERQAANLSLTELEEKIARLDLEQQELDKEREFSILLLEGRMKALRQELTEDLESFKKATTGQLRKEVEAAFHQKAKTSGNLRQEMEAFLFEALRERFTLWRRQELEKLCQKLDANQKEYGRRISALLERLTQITARIFDFSLRGFSGAEEYFEKGQFWFKFKDDPVGLEILQESITALLPRALTRGLLLKKLLDNVTELVDRHCGRMRYDFHRRVEEIARDIRQTWLDKLAETSQGIRQALDRAKAQKQASTQEVAIKAENLDQRLGKILGVEAQLLDLRERIETALI